MLPFFILLFVFPSSVLSQVNRFSKQPLPPPAMGPESYAFDLIGRTYTGVGDGRILRYNEPQVGFQDYAFDSANSSKAVCDGNTDPALGPTCGRPLGIGFHYTRRELYIADAYLGLLVAGTNGRLATQLVTGADGQPFHLLDGLDVDQVNEIVYLTDASARYGLSQIPEAVAANDSTGRLIKYDIRNRTVTVLLKGLSGPAGVAVSSDSSYVLVTEFIAKRVQKYWLRGPKANTAEVLVNFQGRPDNIKRTALGDFWVAVNIQTAASNGTNQPTAIRIDGSSGRTLASINLSEQYNNTLISEVQQYGGVLFIGSMSANFVGIYRIV